MAFAIYNTVKLKSEQALLGSQSHTARTRFTPNADPFRAGLNRQLIGFGGRTPTPDEFLEEWKKRTAGVSRKKDAVLCQEVLLSTSREYYDGCKSTSELQDRCGPWADRSIGFLTREFGDRVLSATLHFDETTPHIAAYVIPLSVAKDGTQWLSGKKIFSPITLRKQQDNYAAAVADLGLERGIRGSKADHVKMASYYAKLDEPLPEISEIKSAIEEPILWPEKGLLESSNAYVEKIEMEAKKHILKVHAAAKTVEVKAKETERLRKQNEALVRTNREKAHFLKEMEEKGRDIPLAEVIAKLGFGDPNVKRGKDLWDTGEHLITVTGCQWIDEKGEGAKGTTAMGLVQQLMFCDHEDAAGLLVDIWPKERALAAIKAGTEERLRDHAQKGVKALWMRQATPNQEATDGVKQFLTRRCGIDPKIVAKAIEGSQVYGSLEQLRDGSTRTWCVFPHRNDTGKIRGGSLRAADPEHRIERALGDRTLSFFETGPELQKANKLVFVENPVDALCCSQRDPWAHVVSVAGTQMPPKCIELVRSREIAVEIAFRSRVISNFGADDFIEQLKIADPALPSRVKWTIPFVLNWKCDDWSDVLLAEAADRKRERGLASPDVDDLSPSL